MAVANGQFEDEGWRVRKDGTLFWASVVITALKDAKGAVQGFSKITRDLSERRKHEESLRQSEERFRLMVESVKDYAIFMLTPMESWRAGTPAPSGSRVTSRPRSSASISRSSILKKPAGKSGPSRN
jgi:PAS domain-containing protein